MTASPILLLATTNEHKTKEFQAALKSVLQDTPLILRTFLDYPHAPDITETGSTFLANATLKARETFNYFHHHALEPHLWGVLSDDSGLIVPALDNAPGVYSARYAGKNASDADNRHKLLQALEPKTMSADREAKFLTCLVLLYHPSSQAWYETMDAPVKTSNDMTEITEALANPVPLEARSEATSEALSETPAPFTPKSALETTPEVALSTLSVTGTVSGWIAHEERGNEGFGYDRLFIPTLSPQNTPDNAPEPNLNPDPDHSQPSENSKHRTSLPSSIRPIAPIPSLQHGKTFAEMSLTAKNACSHRTDALAKLRIPLQTVTTQIFGTI